MGTSQRSVNQGISSSRQNYLRRQHFSLPCSSYIKLNKKEKSRTPKPRPLPLSLRSPAKNLPSFIKSFPTIYSSKNVISKQTEHNSACIVTENSNAHSKPKAQTPKATSKQIRFKRAFSIQWKVVLRNRIPPAKFINSIGNVNSDAKQELIPFPTRPLLSKKSAEKQAKR